MEESEARNNIQALESKIIRSPKPPAFSGRVIPIYSKSLVSFIDTLGFSNFIKNSKAVDIANLLSCFYETSVDYCQENKENQIINFSDSTVRVHTPVVDPDDEFGFRSPLVEEVQSLAAIQFELSCWQGVFLRGGLTFGEVFCGQNMVFGQALIDAYRLESAHAIYPRILVDPKLIRSLDQHPELVAPWSEKANLAFTYGDSESSLDGLSYTKKRLETCLIIDEKENIFLDYLGMKIKGADIGFVLNHKNAIENHYKFAKDDRVREKYAWLKKYHNFSISSGGDFREIGINDKNMDLFLINDDLIQDLPAITRLKWFQF